MLENLALVSPLSVHYFSSVSENSITMKRNRIGATLSPCLTPTLNSIVVSNSPITNLTKLSLYIIAMVSHRFGGHHHQLMVRCIEGINQVGEGYPGGEVMVVVKVK